MSDDQDTRPDIRVRATARGCFGTIKEPGDIFTFKDPVAFHKSWMERVDEDGNAIDENGKRIPSEVTNPEGRVTTTVASSDDGEQATDDDGGGSASSDVVAKKTGKVEKPKGGRSVI